MVTPRHLVASVVTALACGQSPGAKDSPGANPNPAPLPALEIKDSALIGDPVPDGKRQVSLLSPGSAPRAPLRYRPSAGTRRILTARTENHVSLVVNETPFMNQSFPVEHASYQITVTGAESSAMAVEIVLLDSGTEDEDKVSLAALGSDYQSAHDQRKLAEAIHGSKVLLRLDDRGLETEHRYQLPPELSSLAVLQAEQILRVMRSELILPLPGERVGIGARWRVVDQSRVAGLSFQTVRELELLSRAGNKLTIEATQTSDSPPQMITNSVEIESMEQTTTQKLELSLEHPAVVRSVQNTRVNALVKTPTGGAAPTKTSRLESRSTVTYESRPDSAPSR